MKSDPMPKRNMDHERQLARSQLSRNEIEQYETTWDFHELHSTKEHVKHVKEHKVLIKSTIESMFDKLTISGGAIITLLIGIGDPEPTDANISKMMNALLDMKRVIFTQSGELEAEILPIKLYCFKTRKGFEIQIGHLTGKEGGKDDTIEFAPIMEIPSTSSSLSRLFDKLDFLSRAPFTDIGDDETPFMWKKVICELYKSAPTPRVEFQDPNIANVFKQTSIDYSKELTAELVRDKSDTRRRVVIIELTDSRSDTGPAESDV